MAQATERAVILVGRHPVLEALRSRGDEVEEVLLAREEGHGTDELLGLARQAGVRCARAPRAVLTALAGTTRHQGVVARVAAQAYAALEAVLAVPALRAQPGLFVVLDQVQDPANLGNLLRTAEALGAHGVLLPRHQAVGLTATVRRVAAGALEYLAVTRVGNLGQALQRLKDEGCWVVGGVAGGAGSVPPWRLDLSGPVALVLGSEGHGLRPLVARTCDALAAIPMAGRLGSLNVAAAGAALLYEVVRQRGVAPAGRPEKNRVDSGGRSN